MPFVHEAGQSLGQAQPALRLAQQDGPPFEVIRPPSKATLTYLRRMAGRLKECRLSSVMIGVVLPLHGKKDASKANFYSMATACTTSTTPKSDPPAIFWTRNLEGNVKMKFFRWILYAISAIAIVIGMVAIGASPGGLDAVVGGIIMLVGAMLFGFLYITGRLHLLLKRLGVQTSQGDSSRGLAQPIKPVTQEQGEVDPVGQIVDIDGQKLGVIDFGETVSRSLRSSIHESILTHGEPFRSGGVLGPAALPLIGMGSAALSSLAAGNVFLATANPATLMKIGSGVGSQVVNAETGKIVAQARFIGAGSAIIPVVVPIMLFMTVFAMMMLARFDQVQVSLDKLMEAVFELLKREIAGDYGLMRSANERLQDITEEFEGSRTFTDDMKIRLALVERDLSSVLHKYDIIVHESIAGDLAAGLAPIDQHIYTLSAIANMHVDRLRLRLSLQENPDDLRRSVAALNRKIEAYEGGFRRILEDNPVLEYRRQLEQSVKSMSWWKRNIVQRKERKKREESAERARSIHEDQLRDSVFLDIREWIDSEKRYDERDKGIDQAIIFCREDEGRGEMKAYYTGDIHVR